MPLFGRLVCKRSGGFGDLPPSLCADFVHLSGCDLAGYISLMTHHPLRSVLYVPASSEKALAKIPSLACDAVIIDFEDAVHPDARPVARETLVKSASSWGKASGFVAVRINRLDSQWGIDDLKAAMQIAPHAIVLPKVEMPSQITALIEAMDSFDVEAPKIWAMIETPRGILNAAAIAELGLHSRAGLTAFIAGTNDLMKDTGVRDAAHLAPWLMQLVLAAKAGGIAVLDGVHNDFRDTAGFDAACALARDRGFDGKTLIHPAQIEAANRIFSPGTDEVAEANAIVAAFALPENAGKGVVQINGKMVERLHLAMAETLLARLSPQ